MRNLKVISLATAAALTATGNGAAVDVRRYSGEARLALNASATGAAGQTYNAKIQDSADGSTGWTDTGIAFAQVGNAAASQEVVGVNVDRFRAFIRVVDTLAGTNPTVTRAVTLIAKAGAEGGNA